MIYLHDAYNMHSIFAPGFPGMLECFHAQEELVKLLMPDVAEVFVSNLTTLPIHTTGGIAINLVYITAG
jgi:hypothetical protein